VIAVIFEVTPRADRSDAYFDLAAKLRSQLEQVDGFLSVERFESLSRPGKFLSLSFWRDEDAVTRWRSLGTHRQAQIAGRAEIFADYRLRVASVIRDYGMDDRSEAPADSIELHSPG